MKKFEIGKKYVLHSNNNTYECVVKARNEIYEPKAVYIILDVKVTMPDNEYTYSRAFKVMDTSFDYECECVELTTHYYGSILTACNYLNDGKLHYNTLNYIKNNKMLRAFLLENNFMQLPQKEYDMILNDVIKHNNSHYSTQYIASRYDFSFESLHTMFQHCSNVFNYYIIETPDDLLEVLSHDVLTLQLMHNIVEYAKVVYNTPTHKDKLTKMIHRYNLYYRDYMTMISV